MNFQENTLTYEDYYRLRQSAGWNNFAREQAISALNNTTYTVTALNEGRTIAMGRLIGDGIYFLISDVIVDPDFQGRKIGTQIITKLLEYAENQTPPGGRTSVQLIAEKGKESFYEKIGFKLIPHQYCGSGMRMVIHK